MSGTTSLDSAGAQFIAGFEGGQSPDGLYRAYWDAYGRVWTIGIGETAGVKAGMVWTRAQAYADLIGRFARDFAPAINALEVELSQNEFNALASFVWNLGAGSMQWDVGRLLKAGNKQAAADAMLAYDRAGGTVLAGLARRRHAERALFLTPDKPTEPADPHHYLMFDIKVRDLGQGRKGSERQLVMEYDRERAQWLKFPGRLKVLREDLNVLAGRLDAVIEAEKDPKANEAEHRMWRRDQLRGRADGKRYV